MAKALSQDLRDRVVASVDGGLSRRGAAARFGVSVSSAIRWHQLAREHGRAVARRPGGDQRSSKTDAHTQARPPSATPTSARTPCSTQRTLQTSPVI